AAHPAEAAEMLENATKYIEENGDMDEFRERIGAAEWDSDTATYDVGAEFPISKPRVWLPSDGKSSAALCGPVRMLGADEIATLNATPPKQIPASHAWQLPQDDE